MATDIGRGACAEIEPLLMMRALREPSNAVGVHLSSFGGAVKTASWMRELI